MFITGQVFDSEGLSVPSATARVLSGLSQLPDLADLSEVDSKTRADGTFRVEVFSPGKQVACAQLAGGLWSEEVEVHLGPDEPATPVLLHLPRNASIEGQVLDVAGNPVEKLHLVAFVDLKAAKTRIPRSLSAAEFFGTPRTRTDAEGRFVLGPVRGGTEYQVRARKSNEVVTTLGSATSVTIELPPLGGHGSYEYGWGELRAEPAGVELNLDRESRLFSRPGKSVIVQFSTEPGSLPKDIIYELRRMGPHGRVLLYESGHTYIDERGAAIIDGLEPLAAYSLRFQDCSGLTSPTETFVAGKDVAGKDAVALEVELDSRYETTLCVEHVLHEGSYDRFLELGRRAMDPKNRTSTELDFTYIRLLTWDSTRHTVLLPVGQYSAQLMCCDHEPLIFQDFEVPAHPSTIELVFADGPPNQAESDPKMIRPDQ